MIDDYAINREQYIRVTSLTQNDEAREILSGRATGGNFSLDGSSAIRRSISLTFIAFNDEEEITDPYWAFENKFHLEIGVRYNNDAEIEWFDKGIFVITSFSKSKNANNGITISINAQDKMCRLNGTVSGLLSAEHDFGVLEEIDAFGTKHINKIPIYSIIYNMLLEAGERPENIIINDLDEFGYELWEYRGTEPMYFLIEKPEDEGATKRILNMFFDKNNLEKLKWSSDKQFYSMNTLDKSYNEHASIVSAEDGDEEKPTKYLTEINTGDTAGYHRINLVYNGDLIAAAGESYTSVLDKIVKMLGAFEYFYDIKGRFVFQQKKTYIQEVFSPINGEIVEPTMSVSQYAYEFDDDRLFNSFSYSPKVDNVKNDFSVWGENESQFRIHGRVAIDKKPTTYTTLPYYKPYDLVELIVTDYKDGDYYGPYKKDGNNYIKVNSAERAEATDEEKAEYKNVQETITPRAVENKIDGLFYYSNGTYYYMSEKEMYNKINGTSPMKPDKPGRWYELQLGQDFNADEYDWRELIYRMAVDFFRHNQEDDFLIKLEGKNSWCKDGKTGYEQYYTDMQGFWRQLYDPNPPAEKANEYYTKDDYKPYWNKKIHTDPNSLFFWFDFIDSSGAMNKYSVSAIGQRPKVDNNSLIKTIYNKETPEVMFIVTPKEQYSKTAESAFQPIWIPDSMENLFTRSSQGLSVIQKINELINNHLNFAETLSATVVPMWYLEPNTRIRIGQDDYTVDKISCSLTYNSMMSLTLTKINTNFY